MEDDSGNMERVTSPTSVTPFEAGSEGRTTSPIGPPVIPPPLREFYDRFDRAFKSRIVGVDRIALFLECWPYVVRLRQVLPRAARSSEIDTALAQMGFGPGKHSAATRQIYIKTFMLDERLAGGHETLRELEMRHHPIELAPAGKPGFFGEDYFRSQWEERTAKALTRLGIKWTYEPDWFSWEDRRGLGHRYTPDFRLDDLTNTYVEVKGQTGPDAGDSWKMSCVMERYPNLTLLLWDAGTVEYIEDLTEPAMVLALLRTTRLAA